MVDAWSVIVTREPEWDEYTRSEAIADLEVDRMRCGECGQEGTFEPVPNSTRHWTWLDGRVFEVQQFRCLACAALDTIKRDFDNDQRGKDPVKGVYAPGDGLRLVVHPLNNETR
jgi:hypothetical protein